MRIFIGYEPREIAAYIVTRESVRKHARQGKDEIYPVVLEDLVASGLYTRSTEWRRRVDERWISANPRTDADAQLYDTISEHPMSTQFAISRFFVPHLSRYRGWSLFMDCDMLVRRPLIDLKPYCDPEKAVVCVKHRHEPTQHTKMDARTQSRYDRKNWSSFMIFNCGHPSNQKLDLDLLNSAPGRDLHAFCWLEDDEIGELPQAWNYLVDYTDLWGEEPANVHWTNGAPCMYGYENVEYADTFRRILRQWIY